MMTSRTHELKTWPISFEPLWQQEKKAEFRHCTDRVFNVLDDLRLREWKPALRKYSGREIIARITHIERNPEFGIPEGYAMLSLFEIARHEGAATTP